MSPSRDREWKGQGEGKDMYSGTRMQVQLNSQWTEKRSLALHVNVLPNNQCHCRAQGCLNTQNTWQSVFLQLNNIKHVNNF